MEPALDIRMVWENLALAIALWTGAKKGLITKDHLPTGKSAVTTNDGRIAEVWNPLKLRNDQDLLRCINNQVRGAVTFAAIQGQNALESAFSSPPLREVDPDLRAARCVIYLLSAALGQDMMEPVWSCPGFYREQFEVKEIEFVLDASCLDGQPVSWGDFGGLDKFLALLEYCAIQVEQVDAFQEQSPEPPILSIDDVLQSSANQLPFSLQELEQELGPELAQQLGEETEPVSAFLEARCILDSESYTIAKDLFAAYLDWCQETGQTPLAQRSFGIRLTNLGFERKRRGRGRHWWKGIMPPEAAVG